MNFWWVNQKQTGHHEIPGGYIWAPIPKSNILHHENVKFVQKGDVIFSHIRGEIVAIGVAQNSAYESNKPSEFSPSTPWRNEGRRVDVDFEKLDSPIKIGDVRNSLMPTLPSKYSPLNESRGANQGYLYRLPGESSEILLEGFSDHTLFDLDPESRFLSASDEEKLTERIALRKSRIGQGKFREDVLVRWGGKCAVTPIEKPELLVASHIKPWSVCDSSREKLDPNNGLLLSVGYDSVFDKGFVTFDEGGRIVISDHLDSWEPQILGISDRARLRDTNDESERYMDFHRRKIFLA